MNSMQFARTCVTFSDDLLKLFTTELEDCITEAIAAVYQAQVAHIENSLKSESLRKEHPLILKNAQFLLETVMGRIESLYSQRDLPFPMQLQKLNAHFRKLKTMVQK